MSVLSLLGGVPAKAWGVVLCLLACWGGYAYITHEAYTRGVASMQAKVDAATLRANQAEAANGSAASVIESLKLSQAQCEAGRLADQTAAAKALAGNDAQSAAILDQLKRTKAQVLALMRGECKAWAEQASCGI